MMLQMDYDVTANRFILPVQTCQQLINDITRYQPRLYLGEGDEFFKASARKEMGAALPYPTGESDNAEDPLYRALLELAP